MNAHLPSIGFGITSWRSPKTLAGTLETYAKVGLPEMFDDCFICLQDASEEDIEIAKHFGIRWTTRPNQGIAESMRRIAQELDTDLVLFLENDCPVAENAETIRERLNLVQKSFAQNQVDIFRLRHRWNVGEMFAIQKYLACHGCEKPHPNYLDPARLNMPKANPNWLQRLQRSHKAKNMQGRAIYVEASPEKRFPDAIHKMGTKPDEWFTSDSRFLNWTNQSCVTRKDWFLNTLMPYVDAHPSKRTSNGFQSPERPLNCKWWRQQQFKIGVGTGIFTHKRIDGSWRAGHEAYEPNPDE